MKAQITVDLNTDEVERILTREIETQFQRKVKSFSINVINVSRGYGTNEHDEKEFTGVSAVLEDNLITHTRGGKKKC